ncbi:hypothetical protein FUAX_10740 [Fulvitalea axinellae]|uniref:DUF2752 domain-containing protein n=1 Tax=Fulvitalea axinellae TaxID=1182444 RepID=A0AAU9CNX3_9BACT|nr:hypothetical protein FUAX_10740 [Fulvitalea axinellae]
MDFKGMVKLVRMNFELIFWLVALVALFVWQPGGGHIELCPLKNIGFPYCPGCGIGRSLHYAMLADFGASFSMHPLGPVALAVILRRVWQLIKNFKHIQDARQDITDGSRN